MHKEDTPINVILLLEWPEAMAMERDGGNAGGGQVFTLQTPSNKL